MKDVLDKLVELRGRPPAPPRSIGEIRIAAARRARRRAYRIVGVVGLALTGIGAVGVLLRSDEKDSVEAVGTTPETNSGEAGPPTDSSGRGDTEAADPLDAIELRFSGLGGVHIARLVFADGSRATLEVSEGSPFLGAVARPYAVVELNSEGRAVQRDLEFRVGGPIGGMEVVEEIGTSKYVDGAGTDFLVFEADGWSVWVYDYESGVGRMTSEERRAWAHAMQVNVDQASGLPYVVASPPLRLGVGDELPAVRLLLEADDVSATLTPDGCRGVTEDMLSGDSAVGCRDTVLIEVTSEVGNAADVLADLALTSDK